MEDLSTTLGRIMVVCEEQRSTITRMSGEIRDLQSRVAALENKPYPSPAPAKTLAGEAQAMKAKGAAATK